MGSCTCGVSFEQDKRIVAAFLIRYGIRCSCGGKIIEDGSKNVCQVCKREKSWNEVVADLLVRYVSIWGNSNADPGPGPYSLFTRDGTKNNDVGGG